MSIFPFQSLAPNDILLEDLPESVLASMELRDAWVASVALNTGADEFVVADLQKWLPGSVVRVAFLGGTPGLHQEIAETVLVINQNCNIKLDFGFNPESRTYRSWSEADTEYSAEIRMSFNKKGTWSLVGTDSINASIGAPTEDTGGRPNQRSLNLGGFDIARPVTWKGTVLHEFLHALGFKHEHQNVQGPCENDFRWDDDPGYEPTQDQDGRYITDASNRRPGIYTYLAGFPNHWQKSKVDRNLRTQHASNLTTSEFDQASIMLYRFDALFYKSRPSKCAPLGDGQSLSEGDLKGLKLLYPTPGDTLTQLLERRTAMLSVAAPVVPELPGVETRPKIPGLFAREVAKILSK